MPVYVARHRTARAHVWDPDRASGALSGEEFRGGQSCRDYRHARDGAPILCARPIGAGFSMARKTAASLISPPASATSGRTRIACSRSRKLRKPMICWWRRPTPPGNWAFSVRRPLRSAEKSSGVMTASTTPWRGPGNPRPELVTRQFALVRPGGPAGGVVLAKLGRVAWRS